MIVPYRSHLSFLLNIVVLLCFLMAPACLHADTLSGTVLDQSGALVPGARIEITGGDLAQPLVLSSDGEGKFSSPDLKPGTYSMRISRNGFEPLLKAVELDVVPDAIKVLQGYRSGHYDLVGLGDYGPGAAGTKLASELTGDPAHAAEVHRFIYGRTEWLGFNLQSGPFSGVNGRLGRLALSQAIDPVELARAACASGTLCFPATGGLISKGLDGYLGDGSNNVLRFNVRDARANLQEWDPTGSVRNRITYVYIANSLFRDVAKNLQRQWRRNLGIEVTLQGYDPATFIYDRLSGDYALFRASWAADYNSPENWYDDLFLGNGAPSSAPGYDSPQFVTTVTQAENASGAAAQNAYQQADRMLLEQAVIDPLLYYVHTVVMKPYVAGFGANALYDYRWTAIKLLQH